MTGQDRMNPLLQMLEYGQSYWLDNLTRGMLADGTLARRVAEDGLRGVTSNPAIFRAAITDGEEYDAEIERMAEEDSTALEIYEQLTQTDVRDACDVLRPVYDASGGTDGFVSLEVSPHLARDAGQTLDEARRLFADVDRPNLMIKIPGTPEGVPAIEEAVFEGINVNVTLLFGIAEYEAAAEAYQRALERRVAAGRSADDVASVASFFLSRIDALADGLIEGIAAASPDPDRAAAARALSGLAAIANAKLAYESFEQRMAGDRWVALERAGARAQRLLWASTSTKNPAYSDVKYVEPLIGEHTVNTLPESTIAAFRDHGRVADTIRDGVEDAQSTLDALAGLGLDFGEITDQLLEEGIDKFVVPFDELIETLAERRATVTGRVAAALAPGGDG